MVRGGCLTQIRIPNPGLVVPKSGIKSGRIPDILTLSENAILFESKSRRIVQTQPQNSRNSDDGRRALHEPMVRMYWNGSIAPSDPKLKARNLWHQVQRQKAAKGLAVAPIAESARDLERTAG